MVELKPGDLITLCASVRVDFCTTSPLYSIGDINLSAIECIINTYTPSPGCPSLSGIQLEFQWVNSTSTPDTRNCTSGTMLKSLGTATTNSQGVASISYTITDQDAALYYGNNTFDLRVCIRSAVPLTNTGAVRGKDPIIIRDQYIGNNCVQRNTAICLNDETLIVYENPIYATGTITQACVYRSGSSQILPEAKIKVFRLTGTTWNLVGESGYLPLQNNGITTFTGLNIQAQKGDFLAIYTNSACVAANGASGLYYAKIHSGDILTSTNDTEWTTLQNFKVAINATVIPCQGITCPNVCVGYDLYSQTCDPVLGCVQGSLIMSNSPDCGYVAPGIITHYLYLKVPEAYGIGDVISSLGNIFTTASNAISEVTNFRVTGIDFDSEKYIVTLTLEETQVLGTSPNYQYGYHNYQYYTKYSHTNYYAGYPYTDYYTGYPVIKTMIGPLAAVAVIFAIMFAIGLLIAFGKQVYMYFFGSESVSGQVPTKRTITVTANICNRDSQGNPIDCTLPTAPNAISIEYSIGKEPHTAEINNQTPTITFEAPVDSTIVITAKVKDNPYYGAPQTRTITKDNPPVANFIFSPAAVAEITPGATTATGAPVTGKYLILVKAPDGGLQVRAQGDLDANGKVPSVVVMPSDVPYCTIIIPDKVRFPTLTISNNCGTLMAGEKSSPTVIVNECSAVKNSINLWTAYVSSEGWLGGFIADTVEIRKPDNTIFKTLTKDDPNPENRTEAMKTINGLDKDVTYTVHVVAAGYTILDNDQTVSFTTDCGTITAMTIKATPPVNTYDTTIEVRNCQSTALIQGANVILGALPAQKTGTQGLTVFKAVPAGDYNVSASLEGFKTKEASITVPIAAPPFPICMDVESIAADTDTRIYDFKTVGDVIANKSVKFKGALQFLDGTTWKYLVDADIAITVKDKDNNVLIELTGRTSDTFLGLGYFETGEWTVPANLTETDISVHVAFAGLGKYKPSSYDTTYNVAKESACAIPIPFTNSCLISKEAGTGMLLAAGLLIGGLVLMRTIPAAKEATEVRIAAEEMAASRKKPPEEFAK